MLTQKKTDRLEAPGFAPPSSEFYVDDCAALTVAMAPGIPPRNTTLRRVVREISGVVFGELSFLLSVTVDHGHRGWAYLCPRCRRRVFILFFAQRSTDAACRKCLGLKYRRATQDRQYTGYMPL